MAPATKRAAASSPVGKKAGRPARSPKKAKVEPKYELLEELKSGLSASCLEMLMAALPHALETPKEERHGFQSSVLSSIAELSAKEQAKREVAIVEAEQKVAEHAQGTEEAAAKLEAAKAEEATRLIKKQAAKAHLATVTAASEEAAATEVAAKKAVEEAEAEAELKAKDKEEFTTKLGEVWAPTKEGSFAKKDWRLRQKTIVQVSNLLAKTEAPESLKIALPVALKDTPDARSAFAVKAVEEAERLFSTHATALDEAITAAKAAAAGKTEAATSAAGVAKDAAAALDQAQEVCIAADNEWLEVEEEARAFQTFIRDAQATAKGLAAKVDAAKASLKALLGAIAAFKVLEEPPPPVPVAAEAEADEARAAAAAAAEAETEEEVAAAPAAEAMEVEQ